MSKKHTINIITGEETPIKSIMRDAGTFCLFAGLIGFGVLLDSSAMQWAGFVISWITVLAWLSRSQKSNMTIKQAREFLDAMEELKR